MNDNKKMREIVARIKKRREELNLSYEDLSKRTGFGSSTLQRYETGAINRIPIDRFEELAKGLEIEPYKLMGWDEDYLLSQDRKNKTDGDIVDLHNAFLKLNETGRKKILEYIFDILSIDKYVQTCNQSIEITNQVKHNSKYNHNNESETNTYTSASQPATLEEMFTTVAAHNDGIDPDKEKEIDAVFLQAILNDKNKK